MVLLIDNYDSFTYMLRDYVRQAGQDCVVVRHDEKTIAEIAAIEFDSIVISPGPRSPAEAGITPQVIKKYWQDKPILGICLGHQAIGEFFGASLVESHLPMHGKTSVIKHSGHEVFAGVPVSCEVMRYHSLILEHIGHTPLKTLAMTETGEVMAVAHQDKKIVGLQFHPESILTPHGLQMIRNWFQYIA